MPAVLFTNDVVATLNHIIESGNYSLVAVLVDDNTRCHVLPLVADVLEGAPVIEMHAGEENKSLETLSHVWQELEKCGATRHSLLVNLGGGVVTDLGGLAAATYKRGMSFVNVPTTLLAAVDAAVGGKTGINFMGLKNEIGVFASAQAVIVSTIYFKTLPHEQLKSGYAEMLKHAMLRGRDEFYDLLDFDFESYDQDSLLEKLQSSIKVKEQIVACDPMERGPRKALNLGHTVGHAFESMSLARGSGVAHGYAVAWGLVVEAVVSHLTMGFPSEDLYALAHFVKSHYGAFYITCNHYDTLLELMRHDKKSCKGEINCTLLTSCGNYKVDNNVDAETMKSALDIYRDLFGI